MSFHPEGLRQLQETEQHLLDTGFHSVFQHYIRRIPFDTAYTLWLNLTTGKSFILVLQNLVFVYELTSKDADEFLSNPRISKQLNSKPEKNIAEAIAEALKSASNSKSQISADFVRRVNSAGCQCGKQKLEGKPLCGICFSNLRSELKSALRQNRGGELEKIYELAVKTIGELRRERRSQR